MSFEIDLALETDKTIDADDADTGDTDTADPREEAANLAKLAAAADLLVVEVGAGDLTAALEEMMGGFASGLGGDQGAAFGFEGFGAGDGTDPAEMFAEMGFGLPFPAGEEMWSGGIPGQEGLMQSTGESQPIDDATSGLGKIAAGALIGLASGYFLPGKAKAAGVVVGGALIIDGAKDVGDAWDKAWQDGDLGPQSRNDTDTGEEETGTAVADNEDGKGDAEDEEGGTTTDEDEGSGTVAENDTDDGDGEDGSSGEGDTAGEEPGEGEAVASAAQDEDEATGCTTPDGEDRTGGLDEDDVTEAGTGGLGGGAGCGLFGDEDDGFIIFIATVEEAEDQLGALIITDPDQTVFPGEIGPADLDGGYTCEPEETDGFTGAGTGFPSADAGFLF